MVRYIIAVILLAMTLPVIVGCGGGQTSGSPVPGGPAPDFELQSLDGGMVSLSSLQGRPVMVNFWATWCPPCRAEMPYIQEVHENPEWAESGLVILAVNLAESPDEVRDFMNAFGLTFPVLLDTQQEVARAYNVSAIPTTYFIDKDGIIKYVKMGAFRDVAEIDAILGNMIGNVE